MKLIWTAIFVWVTEEEFEDKVSVVQQFRGVIEKLLYQSLMSSCHAETNSSHSSISTKSTIAKYLGFTQVTWLHFNFLVPQKSPREVREHWVSTLAVTVNQLKVQNRM